MTKVRILVADDDPDVVVFAADQLVSFGYEVVIARDGKEALEKAKKERPALIVLDVMMPEIDGYEVCRQLRSCSETVDIAVLMLTAKGQEQDVVTGLGTGADDYLAKPYGKAEFEARVKALLRRSLPPPFSTSVQDDSVMTLSCRPDHRISIRADGPLTFNDSTKKMLDIDPNVYARQADNVPSLDWRFNSKQFGKRLYEQVFVDHAEILSIYNQLVGTQANEEKLHLRFESTRDFLRVPLEFLFEHTSGDNGDYLVLKHPLARSISGIRTNRMSLSPIWFNDLWRKGKPLKILLIASNTWTARGADDIPGVDIEINTLQNSLRKMFEIRGISTQIKTIPTERATYETVKEELKKCSYHIVHYAGHGSYNRASPEQSCLFFWEKQDCQGDVKRLLASELQALLRHGLDLHFVYLSACLGAKVGELGMLLDDDFLGITDSIVHAGVPAVLGYRWPVSDRGANLMASVFYKSLVRQGQIDTALLDARCEVAAQDRDDITWLSPILIMQV